ncbi:MAG TPA: hypothetical protein VLS28_11385 [Candidatus Sulfomarinibacteraceae bacterium]|nr:hypothetical protein [Candidatus Sulfomarinibacteraceae bacterium]
MVRPMRRFLVALALAFAVGGGGLASPPVAEAGPAFVRTVIDHKAKTITFKADIVIYAACDQPRCEVNADTAKAIKKSIEDTWNDGNKIRCYTVKVEVSVVPGPPPSSTDARVGIRIDGSGAASGSFVSSERSDNRWSSDDPADRVVPVNSAERPSTWAKHPANRYTYAHEFGHILGLDDTYTTDEKGAPHDIPGSPHDLMNTGMFESNKLAQETLDRLGKRNGVDESKLKCGWVYQFVTPLGELLGQKCDGIGGTWTIAGLGTLGPGTVSTTYSITIDEQSMQGSYTYTEVIKPTGGSTTTDASGSAKLRIDPTGVAIFDLVPSKTTITAIVLGKKQTVTIESEPETLYWEPAKGECDG